MLIEDQPRTDTLIKSSELPTAFISLQFTLLNDGKKLNGFEFREQSNIFYLLYRSLYRQ